MAGLVPAIHVLPCFRHGRLCLYIVTNRRDGILYTGVTRDLIKRVYQHRTGSVAGFTKRYGLKRLVWFEPHDDIRIAIQKEKSDETLAAGVEGSPDPRVQSGLGTTLRNDLVKKDVDGRDKPGHDDRHAMGSLRSYVYATLCLARVARTSATS